MDIWFSRNLAVFLGIITPILETIRRWRTWRDNPPAFFDDFILGGLLLYGAWRVSKNPGSGQKFLAAAWGFTFGMVYASLTWQWEQWRLGNPDPAPISSGWVLAIKGIGFALAIMGLIASLRKVSFEK